MNQINEKQSEGRTLIWSSLYYVHSPTAEYLKKLV